jgi:hypothetical protein
VDGSNVASLDVMIGLGDVDLGEYSMTRGELNPETGCVAGEVDFEEV